MRVRQVVEADAHRGASEHRHNTAIKDSMRERDLSSIVDAMYSICQLYHRTHPALVASALEAFSEYIKWIDIGLVATDRFLTIFYAFMNPQTNGANGTAGGATKAGDDANGDDSSSARLNLQIYATDCMIEIIEKRMDGAKKIQLLQQLRIIDFLKTALLPSHSNMLLPHLSTSPAVVAEAAERFAEKPADGDLSDKLTETIASLIQSIGGQLIESMEKLVKAAGGAAAGSGGALSSPQAVQSMALVSDAMPMLESALSLGYSFFEHPLFTVGEEVVELYAEYINVLVKRPGTWPWSPSVPDHLRRIFDSLAKSMAFPAWYNHARMDDEDERFLDYRQRELLKLFTNITLASPALILELMAARLQDTLQKLSTLPFGTVEVTLKLFYQIAEPLRANQRTAEEPFRGMIGSLLSSAISNHPHPVISLLYFDLVVRYVKFLDANPDFLGPVLASFLDQRGIRHPHVTVRGRACYLFYKCVSAFPEAVKKQLRPFLDSMLAEIQTVIETVLGPNAPNAPGASTVPSSSRAAAAGAVPKHPAALVSFEDVLHLCESMGILVSSTVTGHDNCHRYVSLAFHFFRTQLESAVAPQSKAIWFPHDQDRVAIRLSQLIESVSSISKALSHDGSRINDLMLDMAHIILQVLTLLPTHAPIVHKTIFFAHRMIDCHPHLTAAQMAALAQQPAGAAASNADTPILQFFALILQLLLKHANAASIVKIIDLLNQILLKFKKKFEPVLDQVFLPTCEKIFEVLASYAHVDQPQIASGAATNGSAAASVPLPSAAYSTERQERLMLQQRYYEFLKSIVASDLVSVFASPTNARHIKSVLDTILQGCVSPPDFSIHRACFHLLRNLVTIWSAQGAIAADPALKQFVVRDVTTQMFKSVCSAHFELGDPNCISAVRELLELQKAVCKAMGEEYINYLAADLMPNLLHVQTDVAQGYCRALIAYNAIAHPAGSEWKQFEGFFRSLKQMAAQQRIQ